MRVLAIGECMVELAPAGSDRDFQLGFAGDTFNTAWYLRALRPDIPVSFFTRVGEDALSRQMLDRMESAGIGTGHIARVPDRTVGLYLITLQDGERSFSYWRGQSAARGLCEDADALMRAIREHDVIYFSGISVAILDGDGRANLLTCLEAARKEGKTVVFDPNLRPALWASADEMKEAVTAAASHSDIVLPSHEDEAVHFGDRDPQGTADRYAALGARLIVVKDGPNAVRYVDGNGSGQVAPQVVREIVDTTAAGDSFNAAFLGSGDMDMGLSDRISVAAKVAGQVIGGKGALVDLDLAGLPFGD